MELPLAAPPLFRSCTKVQDVLAKWNQAVHKAPSSPAAALTEAIVQLETQVRDADIALQQLRFDEGVCTSLIKTVNLELEAWKALNRPRP